MKVNEEGKPIELKEFYLGVLQTLARAPEQELADPQAREWFAQFDEDTWLSDDDFISEFPHLGLSFSNIADEVRRNGQASAFVLESFTVISLHMLDDLRILTMMGFYKKKETQ